MELRELLTVVRRRLWIILSVPIIAAVTAAGLSLFVLSPVYEASTTLWVVKTDGAALDYNTLQFNRNLTKTYSEVAKSQTVARQVIEELGLNETAAELQKRIRVNPVRDTEILSITVTGAEPQLTADIANRLAAIFSAEIHKFIKLDNVRVVDPATPRFDPVQPRPALNTAIALVLGLMAGVGFAFLLEQLDTRIRTPEDVQLHLGLPVIGIIPVIEPAQEEDFALARAEAPRISDVAPRPAARGDR